MLLRTLLTVGDAFVINKQTWSSMRLYVLLPHNVLKKLSILYWFKTYFSEILIFTKSSGLKVLEAPKVYVLETWSLGQEDLSRMNGLMLLLWECIFYHEWVYSKSNFDISLSLWFSLLLSHSHVFLLFCFIPSDDVIENPLPNRSPWLWTLQPPKLWKRNLQSYRSFHPKCSVNSIEQTRTPGIYRNSISVCFHHFCIPWNPSYNLNLNSKIKQVETSVHSDCW